MDFLIAGSFTASSSSCVILSGWVFFCVKIRIKQCKWFCNLECRLWNRQHSPCIYSSVSSLSHGQQCHAASWPWRTVCTGSVEGQIYWGCGTPTHTEGLQTQWLLIIHFFMQEGEEVKQIDVRKIPTLLTNHTVCDTLQDFVERGHSMDRRSFGENWENIIVVSIK